MSSSVGCGANPARHELSQQSGDGGFPASWFRAHPVGMENVKLGASDLTQELQAPL